MVFWGRKSSGYWGTGKGRYNPGIERPKISPVSAPPLGNIFATIQHDDLDDSRDEDLSSTRITEAKYLASYNWLNEGHRIMVPGETRETSRGHAWLCCI